MVDVASAINEEEVVAEGVVRSVDLVVEEHKADLFVVVEVLAAL